MDRVDLRPFLKAAALCSLATAVTTLLLIFLPRFYSSASAFEAQLRLMDNPAYMTRVLVGIVHPVIVLIAVLGVGAVTVWRAPGWTIAGVVGFALWAFTEALQLSLILVAVNMTWRRDYAVTEDPVARADIRAHIEGFQAISDGMFLLILLAFIAGNIFLALAVQPEMAWGRVVRWAYVAGAVLGVLSLLASYLTPGLEPMFAWAYPLVQPGARGTVGVWLWRTAERR